MKIWIGLWKQSCKTCNRKWFTRLCVVFRTASLAAIQRWSLCIFGWVHCGFATSSFLSRRRWLGCGRTATSLESPHPRKETRLLSRVSEDGWQADRAPPPTVCSGEQRLGHDRLQLGKVKTCRASQHWTPSHDIWEVLKKNYSLKCSQLQIHHQDHMYTNWWVSQQRVRIVEIELRDEDWRSETHVVTS